MNAVKKGSEKKRVAGGDKRTIGITSANERTLDSLIPSPTDQNPCAHWRNPMDMILQG